MRSWGDDQLRQELVKAVATLAGIPAADVNWFVCVVVFSATTMAQRFTIAVLWIVLGCPDVGQL